MITNEQDTANINLPGCRDGKVAHSGYVSESKLSYKFLHPCYQPSIHWGIKNRHFDGRVTLSILTTLVYSVDIKDHCSPHFYVIPISFITVKTWQTYDCTWWGRWAFEGLNSQPGLHAFIIIRVLLILIFVGYDYICTVPFILLPLSSYLQYQIFFWHLHYILHLQ